MRVLLTVAAALVVVGGAQAASPVAKTKLGMMPAVQASLLKIETRLAGGTGLPVKCSVAPNSVPIVQCWVMRPGEQHPVVAVSGYFSCGAANTNSCAARPVCTYVVSVSRGFPVRVGFSAVVNVCRAGWEKRVK